MLTSNDAKVIMQDTTAAVRKHLPEIARELLTWLDSGILSDGKLREIAKPLQAFMPYNDAMKIVEESAKYAALEIVATAAKEKY